MEDYKSLTEFIKNIKELIDSTRGEVKSNPIKNEYRSEEVSELIEALAKAKTEFKNIDFNRTNNYFLTEFIDLEIIHHATKNALSKNNLVVIHNIESSDDNISTLHTTLFHSSGQWLKSKIRLNLTDTTINTYRSLVNEYKKVAEMSILDISANNDRDDDDGVKVMVEKKELVANPSSKKLDEHLRTVSADQVKQLKELLENYPKTAQNILERLKIGSFAELPADLYDNIRAQAKKIIKKENSKQEENSFFQY